MRFGEPDVQINGRRWLALKRDFGWTGAFTDAYGHQRQRLGRDAAHPGASVLIASPHTVGNSRVISGIREVMEIL